MIEMTELQSDAPAPLWMRLRGLPHERVMACILRILSTCFMRPGSQVYAKENGSFGIATLQRRHASVRT